MAVISAGKASRSAIGSMRYVVFEREASRRRVQLMAGVDCSGYYQDAATEFREVAAVFNNTGGIQAHHMVLAFSDDEANRFTKKELMRKAMTIAKETFRGHQVWLGLHTDTGHPHVHMIINSVNMDTGKKLHISGRRGMHAIMEQVQRVAKGLGLDSNLEVGKQQPKERGHIQTRNAAERKVLESDSSWKSAIARAVVESLTESTSRTEFIARCQDKGIRCDWSDTRIHIVFQYIADPTKKVRSKNLAKTFTLPELASKESIQEVLDQQRNCSTQQLEPEQQMESEQLRAPKRRVTFTAPYRNNERSESR